MYLLVTYIVLLFIVSCLFVKLAHACRLLPYGCLSTGNRVGFIEIVRRAETIANIQKNEKSSKPKLWDSSLLYTWLKEKNPTEPQYVNGLLGMCLGLYFYLLLDTRLGAGACDCTYMCANIE